VQDISFEDFENLTGASGTSSDAFRFEQAGSVSGTITGGTGIAAFDSFSVFESTDHYTVFNPAIANESGTITFNGKTVQYAGMDHFNPVIAATLPTWSSRARSSARPSCWRPPPRPGT